MSQEVDDINEKFMNLALFRVRTQTVNSRENAYTLSKMGVTLTQINVHVHIHADLTKGRGKTSLFVNLGACTMIQVIASLMVLNIDMVLHFE